MSNAADIDKQAIIARFKTELASHTLDDLSGKASYSVRQKLRSELHSGDWHIELLRLQSQTPRGEFWDRIEARRKEASMLAKAASRKHHIEKQLKPKAIKGVGSGANLGQMAAMILGAHIKAGRNLYPVAQTLLDIKELLAGLKELES